MSTSIQFSAALRNRVWMNNNDDSYPEKCYVAISKNEVIDIFYLCNVTYERLWEDDFFELIKAKRRNMTITRRRQFKEINSKRWYAAYIEQKTNFIENNKNYKILKGTAQDGTFFYED